MYKILRSQPGRPTVQMSLEVALDQPRIQSITLSFSLKNCPGIIINLNVQFHNPECENQKFSLKNEDQPRTAVQSCCLYDSVGLRGSHFRCCRSGRMDEQYPSRSKSPLWKHMMSLHTSCLWHAELLMCAIKVTSWFSNIKMLIWEQWLNQTIPVQPPLKVRLVSGENVDCSKSMVQSEIKPREN